MRLSPPVVIFGLASVCIYALVDALAGGPQGVPQGVQTALAVLWALLPLVACWGLVLWLLATLWLWLVQTVKEK